MARPDHTFDVYAGGGFGLNGSRFGILIDEGVDPLDLSYYILGYGRDATRNTATMNTAARTVPASSSISSATMRSVRPSAMP